MPRLSRRPSHCGYYRASRCQRLGETEVCKAGYQSARLLKLFDLDVEEQVVDGVLLAPVFGVLELLEGFLRHEATRA